MKIPKKYNMLCDVASYTDAIKERDFLIKKMKQLEALMMDRRILYDDCYREQKCLCEYEECIKNLTDINDVLLKKMMVVRDKKWAYYYREHLPELEEEEEKKRNVSDEKDDNP